ncbi:MAG TPA: hypothetical protein VF812_18215 [Ktedonobacterales bacterium]
MIATAHYNGFCWTTHKLVFLQRLFQHSYDNFAPFTLVLDTPQSRYTHDSVTWSFGFDNLDVQKRDDLLPVIRRNPRYVNEMGWRSKASDPSPIFIYSRDEPADGSMLIPTKRWGHERAARQSPHSSPALRGRMAAVLDAVAVRRPGLVGAWS